MSAAWTSSRLTTVCNETGDRGMHANSQWAGITGGSLALTCED
jgi:hypothetical protein